MKETIPDNVLDMIFKLNLPMRIIGDNKKAFPATIRNRTVDGDYIVRLELDRGDIEQIKHWEVELKGRIDVEFVKYQGEIKLTPEPGLVECYRMSHIELKKINHRYYKRVPYRRAIQIVEPVEEKAVLINISASGALIYTMEEIEGEELTFKLILAHRPMVFKAVILEQTFDEETEHYIIRCHFDEMKERDRKHVNKVVREIILRAKQRLNNQ